MRDAYEPASGFELLFRKFALILISRCVLSLQNVIPRISRVLSKIVASFHVFLSVVIQPTLRRRVRDEIESILQDLMAPVQPIKDLLAPFFELYDLVFNTVDAIKEAYQTLKNG